MNALRLSFLFLSLGVVASVAGPLGCGSTTKTSSDAGSGSGGSDGGAAGARGTGGAPGGIGGAGGPAGSSGTDGGRAGSSGADAGAGGAGGTIVIVDAAGNTFTCADLLACCNSVTNAQARALCLAQYDQRMPQGNAACGDLLTQIKANGGCP